MLGPFANSPEMLLGNYYGATAGPVTTPFEAIKVSSQHDVQYTLQDHEVRDVTSKSRKLLVQRPVSKPKNGDHICYMRTCNIGVGLPGVSRVRYKGSQLSHSADEDSA